MRHDYSIQHKNVLLRPLKEDDLELLRNWRNDRSNTTFLRSIPFITQSMQEEWYKKYLEEPNEAIFSIEENDILNRVVGSLSLYDINAKDCMFGKILIGDKEAHGKKIGLNATIAAIKVAFDQMGLERINLLVYQNNTAAKKVYIEAGFSIVESHKDKDDRDELTMTLCKKEGAKYE